MKWIPFFKSDIIEFYCSVEDFNVIPEPYPAFKNMPDWFKKIPTTMGAKHRDHFGAHGQTAKKCMPLVDAMSVGFIIPLFGDVNIRTNSDGSLIDASTNPYGRVVEFHGKEQLGGKTSPTYPGDAIKFVNRWFIKTAPGYSTLFIPPINHIEPRFTCLGGLVDTDKYPRPINFPAIWHLKDYDDILPAGTPLVTCIPIRRSDMPRESIVRKMTDKELLDNDNVKKKQDSRRSVYTNELREPKK
jgi:hypothetical protein